MMYMEQRYYGGHVILILEMLFPAYYQMAEMEIYNPTLISLTTLTNAWLRLN